MEHGFARTYGVELLFESTPQINKYDLLKRLRKHCGRVDLLNPDNWQSEVTTFIHLDHLVDYADGTVPAQTLMSISDQGLDMEEVEPALQQSWDYPDARDAVCRCRSTMLVTDLMASSLDYKVRLELSHNVLLSVLEVTSCLAICWLPSQRFVRPKAYLDSKRPSAPMAYDRLFPAVNVRLFNVENQAPGETLMDTIGLAALGIPDLQCHFTGLDPNDVAALLYNTAHYLFQHGDVINDGETIPGVSGNQRWSCRREMALIEPQRIVIDVNPGQPHAAGNRD